MEFKTGVVVGRFQVPRLHRGHLHLLSTAYSNTDALVVIIGTSKGRDQRNPYKFSYVANSVRSAFPMAIIYEIQDTPSDENWNRELNDILRKLKNPYLFGSRDSFISKYEGNFPYWYVDEIPGISGTKIRQDMVRNASKMEGNKPRSRKRFAVKNQNK